MGNLDRVGDVSTAFYSTGIPNITVYAAMPRKLALFTRLLSPAAGLLSHPKAQSFLKGWVERKVPGPTAAHLATARSFLWGKVERETGKSISATLETPEGYSLTATSALASVERILAGGIPHGTLTPSKAFGADFVLSLKGTQLCWQN